MNKEDKADWDQRFIDLTRLISTWSKDRSTGTGALICSGDNRLLAFGYNGFPSGAADDIEERHERPQKYLYTEHAERNAIYNAARTGVSLKGAKMYLMWFPCADCARSIIQAGIKQLICFPPDLKHPKWGEHFKVAKEMLIECDVEIKYLDQNR